MSIHIIVIIVFACRCFLFLVKVCRSMQQCPDVGSCINDSSNLCVSLRKKARNGNISAESHGWNVATQMINHLAGERHQGVEVPRL